MHCVRQLFRQPIKTLAEIATFIFAVCVLCICVGQFLAAKKVRTQIEYEYTTIALPTAKFQYEEDFLGGYFLPYLPDEVIRWLNETIQKSPELVETVASPGLASAYIPRLNPDNYTRYHTQNVRLGFTSPDFTPRIEGAPYSCAMLEITLEEVFAPKEIKTSYMIDGQLSEMYSVNGIQQVIKGTVKSVIGLQEGFRDPTGSTIWLTLQVPDWESLDGMELVEGERYLVYGMDYHDLDWRLRSEIAFQSDYEIEIDAFDPEKMQWTNEDIVANAKEKGLISYTVGVYQHEDNFIAIDNNDILKYRSSGMTLVDKGLVPKPWKIINGDDGKISIQLAEARTYVNEFGETVTVSIDEYAKRYRVPTIVHLEGTVEEFLSCAEGVVWQEALKILEINNHAFPVIGVDKLGYIAEFARENARIVEGRDFTQEELDTGAKVCIISETLSIANGLAVGETISVQYYNGDKSLPYQISFESGYGTTNPTADFYFSTTPFAGNSETYTIVGLYRQNNAWGDVSDNLYAFTPNTIFTPKSSVTGTMAYSSQGFFRTIVLKNGALAEFMDIVDSAGYEGLFVYYDQGYSIVSENMYNYQAAAYHAMVVGVVVYGILLLLFLFFLPSGHRRTLMVMETLGAGRRKKIAHVVTSSLSILILGTIIGTILGMKLWKSIVDILIASAEATLSLEMEPAILCSVAVVQLFLAFCMILIVAIAATRPRVIMTNK